MTRVLTFGTFDPLHDGHRDVFQQAKALGDTLLVVVARDSAIQQLKARQPYQSETSRLAAVAQEPGVDEAILGDSDPTRYDLLAAQSFDVLAIGYDQQPDDTAIREILIRAGKPDVTIVRLKPFQPEKFKSSYFRPS